MPILSLVRPNRDATPQTREEEGMQTGPPKPCSGVDGTGASFMNLLGCLRHQYLAYHTKRSARQSWQVGITGIADAVVLPLGAIPS